MSISKDIEEAIALWKNSSWAMRAIVALSVFLATSSVTSVADVVFKWKGFIFQGVQFYRDRIRFPISELFDFFNVPEWFADLAIVLFLFYFVLSKSSSGDPPRWKLSKHLVIALVVSVVVMLAMVPLITSFPNQTSFIMLVAIVGGNGMAMDFSARERSRYYLIFFGILFFVCILGAINFGLHKTA